MNLEITSRESLDAAIAEVVRLKATLAMKEAKVVAEKLVVEKKHAEDIANTLELIDVAEADVRAYCHAHRASLFPDKKSLRTRTAEVGFEETPPRVELRGKMTVLQAIARFKVYAWAKRYIRPGKETVDKEALLKDRKILTDEQQALIGVRFEQDEQFFLRPIIDMPQPVGADK
jgi:phage host-nuclease inhibitor protein Gam